MKFGVREICDVVLRAKSDVTIGNQKFVKDEPVMYFDSAKTSTVEGAATTVYAQGGKGNSRLIAWEGERTVTFTMEDALMSPLGFAILSGAGIVDATAEQKMYVHATAQVEGIVDSGAIDVDVTDALAENYPGGKVVKSEAAAIYGFLLNDSGSIETKITGTPTVLDNVITFAAPAKAVDGSSVTVLVDFYVEMASGVQQIEVTPDKFAGSYYLEAATLFRRQEDGKDLPAQFIVPNVKIQSNFTFSMAASGDPSTFTFTMDAFPDYTKFDKTKKVLFALQIVG